MTDLAEMLAALMAGDDRPPESSTIPGRTYVIQASQHNCNCGAGVHHRDFHAPYEIYKKWVGLLNAGYIFHIEHVGDGMVSFELWKDDHSKKIASDTFPNAQGAHRLYDAAIEEWFATYVKTA